MRRHTLGLVALLASGTGCATEDTAAVGFTEQQILADFADNVVIATYGLLSTRITALQAAVDTLAASPTDENLQAAQDAWVAAREPWEQSEGFLFGPVDTFGYDPALDSWPVNHTDLDAVLASGDQFTSEYVANLQQTQKGFHTIEYLVFGNERTRTAANVTARDLAYATAISAELATVAAELAASWTQSFNNNPPYRDVLATAGDEGNSAYPSLTAGVQEILDGMIGICDEVANGKIADPYDAHDPTLVESQYSFNSQIDFQNNLRSVQNAYTGAVPAAGTSGRGLSDYIRGIDSELDARVKREIAAAIEAIDTIPAPFRSAITTPDSYDDIEAAQVVIRDLQVTLERDVQPLVLR